MSPARHRATINRCGFTLLELLAALLLASLLMGAVFRLLHAMHAQERILAQSTSQHEAWMPRIFQLLERDIRNSRQMIVRPNEVLLTGFAGTSRSQSNTTQQAANVVWGTRIVDGRLCLQREERQLDVRTNQNVDRQLIAVGVAGISLWFADAPDVSWQAENVGSGQWTPIPASIIVQLDILSNPRQPAVRNKAPTVPQRSVPPALIPHRRTLLIKSEGT